MQLFPDTDWWHSELHLMLRVPCTTCPYTMQPTLTHTHVLSGAVKMHPAVTCWNWAFKGDTSKSPSNANTCKADTFHKSPEEAELVCVTVWVCMYLYVACVPVNPPLLSSFRKWPLFTCHILLPPPTHTHTHTAVQCSSKSWLFIPDITNLKLEVSVQHYT